jgi:hypothetical protein
MRENRGDRLRRAIPGAQKNGNVKPIADDILTFA